MEADLILYPNPSNDIVYFESNNKKVNQIKIYDLTGSLVLTPTITNSNTINLSELKSGYYIATFLFHDGSLSNNKIIKQ